MVFHGFLIWSHIFQIREYTFLPTHLPHLKARQISQILWEHIAWFLTCLLASASLYLGSWHPAPQDEWYIDYLNYLEVGVLLPWLINYYILHPAKFSQDCETSDQTLIQWKPIYHKLVRLFHHWMLLLMFHETWWGQMRLIDPQQWEEGSTWQWHAEAILMTNLTPIYEIFL